MSVNIPLINLAYEELRGGTVAKGRCQVETLPKDRRYHVRMFRAWVE